MLYCFEFPIDDYYGENVFFKQVYFTCDICPSKEMVIEVLRKARAEEQELLADHPEYGPFTDEYGQCLKAIENLEKRDEFPQLSSNMCMTNSFVQHPKWGQVPLTVSVIQPFII